MRVIKVYRPPGKEALFEKFLAQQDPKLRSKIRWTLFRLAQMEHSELKEPHFKHFALERYSNLYEMREKNKILVRVVFTFCDGDILLLTPFVKRESRDTMRALEQSISMLADVRRNPDYAVNYDFMEEKKRV